MNNKPITEKHPHSSTDDRHIRDRDRNRYSIPLPNPIPNKVASDEYKLIPLTQGKFAIVDAGDYEMLNQHKWCLSGKKGKYYAHRYDRGKTIAMHQEILDVPAGMVCDHINHNRLDNRRCNLRVCTPAQNAQNRLPSDGGISLYKGVCWHKHVRKWQAKIGYQNHYIHIGYYDYEEDAAIAYDDMAIKLFGEFACLNYHCRPEIKQWMQDCYLFPPREIEPVSFFGTGGTFEDG